MVVGGLMLNPESNGCLHFKILAQRRAREDDSCARVAKEKTNSGSGNSGLRPASPRLAAGLETPGGGSPSSPGVDALGMPLEEPLRRNGMRQGETVRACVRACLRASLPTRCDSVRCSCSTVCAAEAAAA